MTLTDRHAVRLVRAACLFVPFALSACRGVSGQAPAPPAPRAVTPPLLRIEALARAKALVAAKDASVLPAFVKLRDDADKALKAPLVAVTDKKTLLPPSGDRHDYFSLSPYWWPDPSKSDGLPYIRRDGETNPESKKDLDQPRVAAMGGNVHTLALAWYFTGDERYALRAGQQLRTWFLDPATRMNPHLRFSQLVRGNDEERGSGIIDTRWFIEAVDASELLAGSPGWTPSDRAALQQWMRQYLQWLTTTPNGQHEHDAKNNHGSWYAAQTAMYALYTGDSARARSIISDAKARIGWQVMPDGSQPTELERTRSYHYSGFNAEALSRLAELGRHVGVDLWSYQAPSGGSLKKAIDHLAKYLPTPAQWPGQQIDAIDPTDITRLMRRAQTAAGWHYDVLSTQPETDRNILTYP